MSRRERGFWATTAHIVTYGGHPLYADHINTAHSNSAASAKGGFAEERNLWANAGDLLSGVGPYAATMNNEVRSASAASGKHLRSRFTCVANASPSSEAGGVEFRGHVLGIARDRRG